MKDRINKTSICSVVFIDIIDYSKKPVSDQIAEKECFNALLTEAIKDVAQNDRIILDTGDGAAIALMGAPEEALFVSLTIRDGIIRKNREAGTHLLVRMGINLGPVRVVIDINGMPNIIGDGINVAQRVMSFAEPNQILVSRSYYEVTSRLTDEITNMFAYSGVKQDKHVREHEVYVIKPMVEEGAPVEATVAPVATAAPSTQTSTRQRYLFPALVLFLLGVVIAGVLLPGFLFGPERPKDEAVAAASDETPDGQGASSAPASGSALPAKASAATSGPAKSETIKSEPTRPSPVAQTAIKPGAEKTAVAKPKPAASIETAPRKPKAKPADQVAKPTQEASATPAHTAPPAEPAQNEKSGWSAFTDSLKQGSETKACSDGERALNQCR
jgi:hypothetical protein